MSRQKTGSLQWENSLDLFSKKKGLTHPPICGSGSGSGSGSICGSGSRSGSICGGKDFHFRAVTGIPSSRTIWTVVFWAGLVLDLAFWTAPIEGVNILIKMTRLATDSIGSSCSWVRRVQHVTVAIVTTLLSCISWKLNQQYNAWEFSWPQSYVVMEFSSTLNLMQSLS